MTYLLDTCIVSKFPKMKARGDTKLLNWVAKHNETDYFLSVVTIGEIQAGISQLTKPDDQRRKMLLEEWLISDLMSRFSGRIIAVDEIVARKWGQIVGIGRSKGVCLPSNDALIAATALTHNLVVVTENGKDFINSGVSIFNPYL
jgi:predicted nucleic acid-binding protein